MLEGIKVFENDAGIDDRGSIWTTWKKENFNDLDFNHDKFSISKKNVLRGLHGDDKTWKLVTCIYGEIFQVVVDLRLNSKTYLQSESWHLTQNNRKQILVPPNFANGFLCLSDECVYHYKLSYEGKYNDVPNQFTIKWNDSRLNINWPIKNPILHGRDK